MNLLELIKSIKGLKCRDNTRQRATKPIDALELESPLDTCRLAGKSCRTASQSRKQSAYWQLVKAYCGPFLKRFFVLSKAAAKMLWRNAIYGQTVEEEQGGGRCTYHCAKMLRLHLSIVNFVCRALSYRVVSPSCPFFLLFQSPVAIHSTLCRRHLIVRHFSAANVILSLCWTCQKVRQMQFNTRHTPLCFSPSPLCHPCPISSVACNWNM